LNQQSIIVYANKNKCPCDHVQFDESMPGSKREEPGESVSERTTGKNEMAMNVFCEVEMLLFTH